MGASWQAFYAHLCAASIIRAMPETEIPPAMRGDLYYLHGARGNCEQKWECVAAVIIMKYNKNTSVQCRVKRRVLLCFAAKAGRAVLIGLYLGTERIYFPCIINCKIVI